MRSAICRRAGEIALEEVPIPAPAADEVRDALGERVVLEGVRSCGRCARCRRGETHLCSELRILGLDVAGRFADMVLAPARAVLKTALEHVRPVGIIVVVGVFTEPSALDPVALLAKEAHVIGSMAYGRSRPRPDFAVALDILESEGERLADRLVDDRKIRAERSSIRLRWEAAFFRERWPSPFLRPTTRGPSPGRA